MTGMIFYVIPTLSTQLKRYFLQYIPTYMLYHILKFS